MSSWRVMPNSSLYFEYIVKVQMFGWQKNPWGALAVSTFDPAPFLKILSDSPYWSKAHLAARWRRLNILLWRSQSFSQETGDHPPNVYYVRARRMCSWNTHGCSAVIFGKQGIISFAKAAPKFPHPVFTDALNSNSNSNQSTSSNIKQIAILSFSHL